MCHTLAKARGGRLLSTEYKGMLAKHTWTCNNGHVWENTPAHIQCGQWCRECSGYKKKTVEDCHALAQKHGAQFKSDIYIDSGTVYEWICANGHPWRSSYDNVKQGYSCGKCKNGRKGQNELVEFCKTINPELQENSRPFPGSRFELDIYYPKLKIAIELDGDYWHTKERIAKRDVRKSTLCDQNGIVLLRISYERQWYRKIGRLAKNWL